MTLLIRSGIAILAGHPMLYWNQDCRPGSQWLKFSRKQMPKGRLWTSKDEEVGYPSWLALPGGHNLGLGRYWHFAAVHGWIYATAIYVVLMLAMPPQWRRLIPSSWTIIPDAWHDFVAYITFHLPGPGTTANPDHPYNALQKLTYFGVVFILTPLQLLTGVAMSPTIEVRFPWYPKLFGNRQAARSIHFLGMVAFIGFLLIHVLMVVLHGFAKEMNKMVMGHEDAGWWGAGVGLAILAAVVLVHVAGNLVSEAAPRLAHRLLSPLVDPPRRTLLHRAIRSPTTPSRRSLPTSASTATPRPPSTRRSRAATRPTSGSGRADFADYRLEVAGLVEIPALAVAERPARHAPAGADHDAQLHPGLDGRGEVGGGPPLRRPRPLQAAAGRAYLVFHSYQFHKESGARYYECIDFKMARLPQTILAYEMNDVSLPVAHGAPLRLRVEPKLGFKMVKYPPGDRGGGGLPRRRRGDGRGP